MRSTSICCILVCILVDTPAIAHAELKAGAAVIDVTPLQFPVFVNGGMTSRSTDKVITPIVARALVLDDGRERLAIVVVDSCMLPRPLLDEAKQLASQRTKIRPDRMLISATHTHTAPSCMGALGTDADPSYVPYLREKLAEAIAAAEANLEPAQVGWAVQNAADYTALRRWIRRPDKLENDPFGNPTVRANMHAGRNWDDVTGESGPEDPDLTMISVQSTAGRPIALLGNFSMHYFSGPEPLNADYFGVFCRLLEERIGPSSEGGQPFVAMMSHGCSGDIWRRDYKVPEENQPTWTMDEYAGGLSKIALTAYQSIEHSSTVDLAMAETRLHLNYRVPDAQRLQWARQIVATLGDRMPKTTEEVYAREQILLHELQSTDIVVQALRIGDIAIATTPNETYALTGLKIKLQSPLPRTMVIELANGGDGYIPPPEQHQLGGYNTWPARTAGLEVQAEPKIAEAALSLLEQVAGKSRRVYQQTRGAAADTVLQAKPIAYWRMDEFAAPHAADSTGSHHDGVYESGVVFFLDGAPSDRFCLNGEVNRAAHFAGGRLRTRLPALKDQYSVSMWIWNGMPHDARPTSGWMYSRGRDSGATSPGEHLGIGGTETAPGKLVFLNGPSPDAKPVVGRTSIPRWTWAHVALVRDGEKVRVYLNGQPEIEVTSPLGDVAQVGQFFFGGRHDNDSNWEGRLDEIAVFDRVLKPDEVARGTAP